MKPIQFQIMPSENGLPLVDVLADHLKISKRKAKTLLDERLVFINRKRVWMAQHTVRKRDEIEVLLPGDAAQKATAPAAGIEILKAAPQWMIVNKPAGLVTNNGANSLEERLRHQLANPETCAVHRLDKDTSGCVLFAHDPAGKEALIPLFRDQQIVKVYRAIVMGKFPMALQTIHNDIDGESASTEVNLLDRRNVASYLELRIRTGRTHQIRKHLQFVKHPVVGDKAYRTDPKLDERLRLLPRQMLHAHKLIFRDPQADRQIRVTAPLPADFKAALASLQLH